MFYINVLNAGDIIILQKIVSGMKHVISTQKVIKRSNVERRCKSYV